MSSSYEAGEPAKITSELQEAANESGCKILHVICDDGETHVDFFTLCDFIPRIGEYLTLENNTELEVAHVMHLNTTINGISKLTANVYAMPRKLVPKKPSEV